MAKLKRLPSEIWYLINTAHREFARDQGGLTAAALAFYTALALVPTALLIISFAGHLLGRSQHTYHAATKLLEQLLPGTSGVQVVDALRAYSHSSRTLVNLVGALGLAWSAINLFGTMSAILTRVWVGPPERGYFAQRLVGLSALVVAGAIFLANLLLASAVATLSAHVEQFGPEMADFMREITSRLPLDLERAAGRGDLLLALSLLTRRACHHPRRARGGRLGRHLVAALPLGLLGPGNRQQPLRPPLRPPCGGRSVAAVDLLFGLHHDFLRGTWGGRAGPLLAARAYGPGMTYPFFLAAAALTFLASFTNWLTLEPPILPIFS